MPEAPDVAEELPVRRDAQGDEAARFSRSLDMTSSANDPPGEIVLYQIPDGDVELDVHSSVRASG